MLFSRFLVFASFFPLLAVILTLLDFQNSIWCLQLLSVIFFCRWMVWDDIWPLTSFGGSDWLFSNIIQNHPQVCNLKSFWHVFEVTSEVKFGLWPLEAGYIEYSKTSSQTIHKYVIWSHFGMFLKWPSRSTLASDLFMQVRLNILKYHPKPSRSM